MKRNLKTKILSVLLAVAMVITSITVWPAKEEAKAASDYVELTFSDFGFEDGVYAAGSMKRNKSITSLDGVAITGDIVLNDCNNGGHVGFQLDPTDDGWTTFQIYRVNNNGTEGILLTHWGATKDEKCINASDLGITDFATTKIRTRLCFDRVSDTSMTATMTMTVGEYSVTTTMTMEGVANMVYNEDGYRIGVGESATAVGLYSVEREYTELTFSNFNIDNNTYTSSSWGYNETLTSMDGVAFTGDFNFLSSGQHTAFRLDPVVTSEVDDDWYNFQVYRDNEKISIRHIGADSFKLVTDSNKEMDFSSSELGNADLSTATVRVRLCFNKLTDTAMLVRTTITVGQTSVTKLGVMMGVSEMISCSSGYRIGAAGSTASPGVTFGSVDVTQEEPEEQEQITLTFSDLGIADGNYAGTYEHGELPSDIASWDNVTVVGNVTMPSNDNGAYIGWAGTTDIASGLKFFANTSEQLWFWNDLNENVNEDSVSLDKDKEDDNGNSLGNVTGESMKMQVTFKYVENDLNMVVVINDAWTLDWTFKDLVDKVGRRLVVSGNVTVESIIEYTELTFCDLGIADGNYNNTSATGQLPTDVESWDKVAINGIIQLPKNNDGPFVAFGATDSVPEGIKLHGAYGNQIWFWNHLTDVTHQGFTEGKEDADGDVLGTILGTPFKLRLEFLEDGTSINVKMTINDAWDWTWTYENMTETIGRIVKVSGDVTVTSIVEYTELTFNDLGFADGNYSGQTATGQLPTGVDSWDRVAISGYLTFYGEGDGNAFRFGGVAAGESVAMFYSGGQFWLWDNLTSNPQGLDASAGTTGSPIKMRMEFLEIGSDLRMTLYMNDAQVKVITYTNMPSVIGTSFGMTGNITVGIPKEPLAVSFNSFGMEANKTLGMTTVSTIVPENADTLADMHFTGYVTFYDNSQDARVSFGVNESGAGIDMFLSGDQVWFWDTTDGVKAAGRENGGIGAFSVSELGLTGENLIGQELKVEVAFNYTDSGVEFYYSVNDVEKSSYSTFEGFQNYIGTGVKVSSGSNAIAYRSSLGEQYSVDNRLAEEGYKRITVADTGLDYKSYTQTTATGTFEAENMGGTYLDMDVNFTDIMFVDGEGGQAIIRYAADDDGWEGIEIRSNYPMTYFMICGMVVPCASVGMESMEETFNVKIALKETTVDGTVCYLMSAWVNEIQICADTQAVSGNIGNKLLVWSADTVNGEANTSTITFEPTQYTEVTRKSVSYSLRGYDHKTVQNYLVTGDATVTKNGIAYTVTDSQISEPGDYTIVTEVASTAHRYTQVVSLYILGDVNLDGTAGEQADLDALKSVIQAVPYKAATAAEYAADIDNDGTVDSKDVELLESVVGDADALTAVLAQYHVPALTYDYLGGDDVMPISGYFGPYADSSRSYLTEDIYQKIKDSGINMINHSVNDAGYELSYVRQALELAEQYNLGWFVSDYKVNPKINVLNNNAVDANAEMLTTTQLAARLGFYSYYDSFLGNHIKDEPSYNGGDQNQDYNMMDYYTDASAQLNSFANTMGIINLPAEDARTINNYNSVITSWRTKDNYDEYWAQYVTDSNPKVYSADDYQFFGTAGTDDAESYFRTLGKIREQSLANNTPFWYYVQVGGDFDHDNATTDTSKIATEAETYWSVNTALAFGAKGIEWFPTIQPTYFDGISDPNTESSADRNGLILSDGTTSTYYDWVQTANAQIAAVDDVLMKATNKAIVATGTYAVREIEEEGCTTTASSYGKLTGVTASNTTQGAVVGCFDYRDTQAFYVMNYSVDGEQTITLTFDNNYDVRIVQDATSTCGETTTEKALTLTLGAGKGALVVLESSEDPICYYCATENANGELVFQCQHTGNELMYGDLTISGDVNAKDLVRMKKVQAEKEKTRFLGIADLNGDGIVNKDDVSLLQKHLVGWISKE